MTPRNREARLRRRSQAMGLHLMKNRSRTPGDPTYGGYMLVDAETNAVVAGGSPIPFSLYLDDAEWWLDGLRPG